MVRHDFPVYSVVLFMSLILSRHVGYGCRLRLTDVVQTGTGVEGDDATAQGAKQAQGETNAVEHASILANARWVYKLKHMIFRR